jgi:hypothetical protein
MSMNRPWITKRAAFTTPVQAAFGVLCAGAFAVGFSPPEAASAVPSNVVVDCDNFADAALTKLDRPTDGYVEIGRSVAGRSIRATRIGSGPNVVVWIGGIHGDERVGAQLTENLVLNPPSVLKTGAVTLIVVEDVNPDGTANGTRTNANGVDLNRNFPSTSFEAGDPSYGQTPLSQPESCLLAKLLEHFNPALTVASHAHSTKRGIDVDGPASEFADAFAAAHSSPSDFPTIDIASTSTPGSLGQWWGADNGHALLTLEWSKSDDEASDVASEFRRPTEALLERVSAQAPTIEPSTTLSAVSESTTSEAREGDSSHSTASRPITTERAAGPNSPPTDRNSTFEPEPSTSQLRASNVDRTVDTRAESTPIGRFLIAALAFLAALGIGTASTYLVLTRR